jgi:hypothetical protein
MISNDPRGVMARGASGNQVPFTRTDSVLDRREVRIERKVFNLELRENKRGRFVRLIETNGTMRDAISIPEPGVRELAKALAELLDSHPRTEER